MSVYNFGCHVSGISVLSLRIKRSQVLVQDIEIEIRVRKWVEYNECNEN